MEQEALDLRYEAALASARARGVQDVVSELQVSLRSSVVTVNCDLSFLKEFVSKENMLYATYHQGVRAGTRKAAEEVFDRHRAAVDALMYGTPGTEVVFGALSLTCRGLLSYGSATMQLRDVAIRDRASLLEENSYTFVSRHAITPDNRGPLGYTSTWSNRDKLGIAKLAGTVKSTTKPSDFQGLLLYSDGDRSRDSFVEVHVYRSFDSKALERVSCHKPHTQLDKLLWQVVTEMCKKMGIPTETYR